MGYAHLRHHHRRFAHAQSRKPPRDSVPVNLRMVCQPVFVGDIREREELLAASMTVDSAAEIKQLFLQYQAAGVDFFRPLKQEPWGARNFIVRDPDGNLLLFVGPAT
jgi:uncharacterized glyoxalase superfamily protein PhnB